MNKLAVFVEGYTEVVFVRKLIEEIAGENNVRIEHRQIQGGGKESGTRRTMALITAAKPDTGQKYFVLICDCRGDKLVKSWIMEEHENLTRAGYTAIIGLRDVRPDFTHAEIRKLEEGLPKYIKTKLIPVHFILAIMEIEAWFLAETTHFPKIHETITVAAIKATLHFDPEHDNLEERPTPADDLNNCYAIAGKVYHKHMAQDTVDALDYALLAFDVSQRFNYLAQLVARIEAFLA